MPLVTDKFRITQSDDNVTLSAGTANVESTVAKFVAPDRTVYEIRPDDIFSLYLADTAPTQLATTTKVKLTHEDPNGITIRTLVLVDYTVLTEFTDRLKLFTFGQSARIKPKDRLFIRVTGNLAADTAQTKFQISTTRVAEALRI